MSWSIYLGGPKDQVAAELEQAVEIIQQAQSALRDVPGTNVSVSVNGSMYSDGKSGGASVGFNISGDTPVPPAPTPDPEPAVEAVAVTDATGEAEPSA